MPVRHYTPDELIRLKLLHELPNKAYIPTLDAVLLSGCGSRSTWQRKKARGETPPAILVNGNTEAYEVGAVKAMYASATEPKAA
jgi:hypothetical protein